MSDFTLYAPGTRKGNRTWLARGTVDGHRFEKVLESTTRADAKEEARRFVRKLEGYRPPQVVTFAVLGSNHTCPISGRGGPLRRRP